MVDHNSPHPNMEDRISNLPDNLIHSILSFIDMKFAVQTSVLSKRWQHIWRSLPFLNFGLHQFSYSRRISFSDFVNRVLLLRDNCCIPRFHLNCCVNIGESDIDAWIAKAVRHNVEELCIGFNEGCKIVLPTSVTLRRLKSMNLWLYNALHDDKNLANTLFTLFTKCPSLESLVLEYYRHDGPINLDISVPTLKYFSLDIHSPTRTGLNKVALCAPNLTSFICSVDLLEDFCLESLSSLVTADVRINIRKCDKVDKTELCAENKVFYAQSMVKLLRGLHNVTVLLLTSDFKVLSGAPSHCQLPEFPNLQRLILTTWLSRGCRDAIMCLLGKSPNIEFLELSIKPMTFQVKDYWGPELSLPFTLYHLKHIVIRGLRGYGNELQFLKIMWKNAMALEEVVLFSSSTYDSQGHKRMRRFKAKLLAYTGVAATSIISFKF